MRRESFYTTRRNNLAGLSQTALDIEDWEAGAGAAGAPYLYADTVPMTSISRYGDTPYVIAASNPLTQPAEAQAGWLDQALKSAESLAKSYMTYDQAKKFNELNLERARQGKPPLNPQQYAPQVNLGVSSDIQKMLLWGGAAFIGVMVLNTVMKRR